MSSVQVRDMTKDDEYFVGCCSHEHESAEIDAACQRRLGWMIPLMDEGFRAKVALVDGRHVGFIYVMPIEFSPWGPLGSDALVIPCLFVLPGRTGQGAGNALLDAAWHETELQNRKALIVVGYDHDFWFMPSSYFERRGFTQVARRGRLVAFWRIRDESAEPPTLLEPAHEYTPVPGKVVVDLYWNEFCLTSSVEAERVREVVEEFGDAVVLNEYPADDRRGLLEHQNPRGLFVNGDELWWGYEAPKEGVREAIRKALDPGASRGGT